MKDDMKCPCSTKMTAGIDGGSICSKCGFRNDDHDDLWFKENKKNELGVSVCDLSICPPDDCLEDCPHHPSHFPHEKGTGKEPEDNQDDIRKAFEDLMHSQHDNWVNSFTFSKDLDIYTDPLLNGKYTLFKAGYKSRDKEIEELEAKLKTIRILAKGIPANNINHKTYKIIDLCNQALSTIRGEE